MSTDLCPHCGADLQGPPIPEDVRSYYGGETHYSKRVGVEIRSAYDGVLFWVDPSCGKAWHRWTSPDMMKKAQPYIDKENERAVVDPQEPQRLPSG